MLRGSAQRFMRLACVAAFGLVAGAAPASGSVTLGAIAPGVITSCSSNFDWVQVSSSNVSYKAPVSGVITSWTHRSQPGSGQTPVLKVFRKTSEPAEYTVMGHDGPEPIPATTTQTFPAAVPIQAGDVLGISGAGGSSIGCYYLGIGQNAFRSGNLPDGGFGDFTLSSPDRLTNLSVVLDPTNTFTLTKPKANKKKGTATVTADLPNPGELTGTGTDVRVKGAAVRKIVAAAGKVKLTIKATGKKRRKLNSSGKVKVKAKIIFTPTGGDPSSRTAKVKLKKPPRN